MKDDPRINEDGPQEMQTMEPMGDLEPTEAEREAVSGGVAVNHEEQISDGTSNTRKPLP